MFEKAISKVKNGVNLSEKEMKGAFVSIMKGGVSDEKIAVFLKALAEKGETTEEIVSAVGIMRSLCNRVETKVNVPLLDIVGTGGGENTFNISTCSMFVAAGAGCVVAKHGNRAATSQCGSADVLEKLGVKIDCNNKRNAELIEEIGIAFLFAPVHHPVMGYAVEARKKLVDTRTIFNTLGPIINPAFAQTYLMGASDLERAAKLATILNGLKVEHALVVHGDDGFDEISLSSSTTIFEVKDQQVKTFQIMPEQFGFERCKKEDLRAKSASESAEIIRAILGRKEKGPKLDIVLLNAGAAIYANSRVKDIEEGIQRAKKSIASGAALKKLNQLVEESNKFSSP